MSREGGIRGKEPFDHNLENMSIKGGDLGRIVSNRLREGRAQRQEDPLSWYLEVRFNDMKTEKFPGHLAVSKWFISVW